MLRVVNFNGGKSYQNYRKITRKNLFHKYIAHGKSFETGRVPVAR